MTGALFSVPVQSLESDERYTPAWVFEHMGLAFDLDPCSPLWTERPGRRVNDPGSWPNLTWRFDVRDVTGLAGI